MAVIDLNANDYGGVTVLGTGAIYGYGEFSVSSIAVGTSAGDYNGDGFDDLVTLGWSESYSMGRRF